MKIADLKYFFNSLKQVRQKKTLHYIICPEIAVAYSFYFQTKTWLQWDKKIVFDSTFELAILKNKLSNNLVIWHRANH